MNKSDLPPSPNEGDGLIYLSVASLIGLRNAGETLSLKTGRIASTQSGGYLSRIKGRGMEFDEARQYQPGDDVRTLDWRVTARTGVPHTKLFREERERPIITWVDMRPSMFFATRGAFKSVIAAKAAALIAWKANKQGDRLGGLIFSLNEHHELRPHRGKAATLHMLEQLSLATQWRNTAASQTIDATESLARLRRVAKPGSVVFLLSDFRHLGIKANTLIAQIARHSEVILFHIHDPLEQQLPPDGNYPVCWQDQQGSFSSNVKARLQHQLQFKKQMEQLERLARIPGIHLTHCATSDDVVQQLADALRLKR